MHISTVKIQKSVTPTDTNTLATYKLVDGNGVVINNSDAINIPKDKTLKTVQMGNMQDTFDSSTGVITSVPTGNACLEFVHQLADGTYALTQIDVSNFLKSSQFGQGLQVSASGVVSINKSSDTYGDNSNKYLVLSEENVNLNGIVTEFETMSAHTINGHSLGTNPILNGADIKLDGYSKSTGTDETSLTVTSTDTVNIALGKITKSASDNMVANKLYAVNSDEIKIVNSSTGTTIELGTIDLGDY